MKRKWNDDQVLSYLEHKIEEGIASDKEVWFYSECTIEDKLIHSNYSRKLVEEMNSVWGF